MHLPRYVHCATAAQNQPATARNCVQVCVFGINCACAPTANILANYSRTLGWSSIISGKCTANWFVCIPREWFRQLKCWGEDRLRRASKNVCTLWACWIFLRGDKHMQSGQNHACILDVPLQNVFSYSICWCVYTTHISTCAAIEAIFDFSLMNRLDHAHLNTTSWCC